MVYINSSEGYNGKIMLSVGDIFERVSEQKDFPRQDIDAASARILSVMLANPSMHKTVHSAAEDTYPIFIGTHQPLAIAAEHLFDDPAKIRAINFGITAFEAVTLFVRAERPRPDLVVLEHNVNGIVHPANAGSVGEYFDHAYQIFQGEMPNTVEVISEASGRHVGSPQLATLGGAIARQFELDNIED